MASYTELKTLFTKKNTSNTIFVGHDFANSKNHRIGISQVIPFYKHYCDSCFNKDFRYWDQTPILSIGENISNYTPIISEFLFKFDNTEIRKFFDESLTTHIMLILQSTIQEMFIMSDNYVELICVLCESERWFEKGKSLIRVKFQFPFCKTSKKTVNDTFRNTVIRKLRETGTNKLFHSSTPVGDWDSHLLKLETSVPLYGSSANPKTQPPVVMSGIYGFSEASETPIEVALTDVFDFKQHSFIQNQKCDTDSIGLIESDCDIDEDDEFAMYTLPMFLSIYFYKGITMLQNSDKTPVPIRENRGIEEEEEDDDEEETKSKSDYEMCLELCKQLSQHRFNEEQYFLDIGRAFYSSTKGHPKGLSGWISTCVYSEKFDRKFCEERYEDFQEDRVTVRTLGWYFRMDNFDKYTDWHDVWVEEALNDALQLTHRDIAVAFYRVNWLKYMYDGKNWYTFEKHRMKNVTSNTLKYEVMEDFVRVFDYMENHVSNEKLKLSEKKKRKSSKLKMSELDDAIEKITKLRKKLKDNMFAGTIVRTSEIYFMYDNLEDVFDSNQSLLGCSNGVIELISNKAVIRDGKPEDFITKKIGVPFRRHYHWEHPDIKELKRYLLQVFPVKEVREFMELDFASYLFRGNNEKYLRVWMGDTNGSKSVLQEIVETWLGEYAHSLPNEVFFGKKSASSGPNPELAQLKISNMAFSSEPETQVPWSVATVKRLTGGDKMFARSCNQDGGGFKFDSKPTIVLNSVPPMPQIDEATKRRCLMVPFESRWIRPEELKKYGVPDEFEEQVKKKIFVMDENFRNPNNMKKLARALCWMAVQKYADYKAKGILRKPAYLQKFLDDYWSSGDLYVAFIEDCLEPARDEKGNIDKKVSVSAKELHKVFVRWYKESYPNTQVVNIQQFTEAMSAGDRLGKRGQHHKWQGWKIREDEEDEIAY